VKSNKYIPYYLFSLGIIGAILFALNVALSAYGDLKSALIFTKPSYLNWLLVIPVFYLLSYRNQLRKVSLDQQFGSPNFGKKQSIISSIVAHFLLMLSLSFVIIALAQPVFGKKKVSGISKNMEIAICLDVSNSMNVRDIQGESRIEVAKRTINGLINQLSGEKIGLCVFAGNAMVQLPLTSDYSTAQLFTEEIQSTFISNQGTNIVEALETGVLMFTKTNDPKCIVMITDGEDHEKQSSEIYNFIREQQIAFYGIGIGTTSGGPIPEDPTDPNTYNKRDANGFTIHSKLNPEYIKQLANTLNGTAIITSEAYPDLNAILTEINRAKSTKSRNLDFEIKASIYEYAVLLALLSMVGWMLIQGIKRNG
jgi:Ca-activated chloride channel homolog